jgi:hypothetical protein
MHFEKPSDVRDIAHYFLQPNNLEILEDCLYYDRDSVFARVREQWMLNKDKDPSSFFQSLSPNDHQDMVRVDSYDRTV